MFCTSPPQALALCLGLVALLLGEHRSFASSLATQQAGMPEEWSTSSPLQVGDLQELLDLKLELNARKEELKQELISVKEQALREVNARTDESKQELLTMKQQALHEVDSRKEQAKQELNDVTEGLLMCLGKVPDKTQKTYRVFEDKVTHPEAVTACDKKGGRLVLPLNDKQNDKIFELVQSKHSTRDQHYWIAADDKKVEGHWRNSITGQRLYYTNFDVDQPDNHENAEDCAHGREWNGKWNDIGCDDERFIYVCEFQK